MACTQTLTAIARDCTPSQGGIRRAYYANFSDVSAITVTSGKISAITMAASSKFYQIDLPKQTGSLSSNWQVNNDNGTKYVQTDLLMVFNRMETTKRTAMMALAQGDYAFIVEDNNGAFWYLGKEEPVVISAGDGLTGTQRADRNGYSVTMQDASSELPYEVDGSIISGLL